MNRHRHGPSLVLRHLAPLLALFALLGSAPAQNSNPVIIEVGATEERLDKLLARFQIAVAGIMSSQGGQVTLDVLEQLYAFLPQFAEQRSGEIAINNYARSRGIVVSDEDVQGIIAEIASNFPDEATFITVLTEAGFSSFEQLAEVLADEEYARLLIEQLEAEMVIEESELQVAYLGIRSRLARPEEVCARHILVSDEGDAIEALNALRSGASFTELALAISIDPGSGMRGGDLGCFPAGVMVAPFEQAAFAATVGEVTEPVQSAFGYHLILVYERVAATTLTLADVRGPLEAEMRQERVQLMLDAVVAGSGVRLYPERIPSFADAFGDALGRNSQD